MAQIEGHISEPCPQLPGSILRVFIPAGAVVNLLNILEVTTPSGICIIVRIPALAGTAGSPGITLAKIKSAIESFGGSIEVVEQ